MIAAFQDSGPNRLHIYIGVIRPDDFLFSSRKKNCQHCVLIIIQQQQTIHQLINIHCHSVIHGINLHLIVACSVFIPHHPTTYHAS